MPHSWELVRQQQEKLLIATLLPPGGVSVDWALAFSALEKPPLWDFMRLSGMPFGPARTQAAYQCLNAGHTWLFFLDSDILAPPNTITRLMSHRLPIVSALYHQRFPTWTGTEALYLPVMFNEGVDAQGNPVRVQITDFQYGQLVECAYAPAGALLIHRSVFERMLAAGIKRFFEWTLTADNPSGKSEDFEACLPPNTMVYGYDVKPIEEIKIGDRILTHKGTLKPVTKLFKRPYSGMLTVVKPAFGEALFPTPNHPMLVKRQEKTGHKVTLTGGLGFDGKIYNNVVEPTKAKIKWVEAKDVKRGDWLFLPDASKNLLAISRLNLNKYVSATTATRHNGLVFYTRTHKNASRIPLNLDMTPKLLRLLGYYIAEGSTGSGECALYFSFGKNEIDYAQDVANLLEQIFEARTVVTKKNSIIDVHCSSKILAHLFTNLCGHTARNKKLPRFFYELDDEQLCELINGYWKGDGRRDGFTATTVSKKLAHQLKLALLRIGILSSIHKTKSNAYTIAINKAFQGDFSTKIGIGNGTNGGNHNHVFKRVRRLKVNRIVSAHGGFWIKIKEVGEMAYDGFVYNLSIDTNESYVAEGVTVHNCARARALGYKIMVDTGIQCIHETSAKVDVKGLSIKL